MAAWLNGIVAQIATHTGVQAHRKWDLCMMNQIPWGSTVDRKPDLVIVDKSFSTNNILKGNKLNWKEFHTYAEVTHLPGQYKLNKTTWQKLFAMFEAQPTRRFIPNVTFRKDHMVFIICDRAGGVHTNAIPLHSNKRRLVQFIVGFSFGDEHLLGYDPMMKHSGGDIITAISVNGQEYAIINRLFKSSVMRVRATQCWHVRSGDGTKYIINDSWIDSKVGRKHIRLHHVTQSITFRDKSSFRI